MGLIKAGLGAIGSTFSDQWKEFFTCDSLSNEVLVARGKKQTSSKSSNTKGNENVISNGSGIAVADGQCMIIVEQGEIVEFCAEPGEYTFDTSIEPSIFNGELNEAIKETFKTIAKRFTMGGDSGVDQRVYYFNLKELTDNKFGTPTPIPFRVVDHNIGLDIDVSIRCSGVYSYKIVDPLLFYTNVCGNIKHQFTRSEIDTQLKAEFITALQPAFAKISSMEVRPSALPAYTQELSDAMNEILTKKWAKLRGLAVISVALNPISLPEDDAEMIKELQRTAVMRNTNMAAATLVGAQADAMKSAASNDNGAMMGFMGMNMAQNAGGMNAQNLFSMNKEENKNQSEEWTCNCGSKNIGKFCSECGKEQDNGWRCECKTVNKGKFCFNCGKPKPKEAAIYQCDKCGWQPENPSSDIKFCPLCGDKFDENDIK